MKSHYNKPTRFNHGSVDDYINFTDKQNAYMEDVIALKAKDNPIEAQAIRETGRMITSPLSHDVIDKITEIEPTFKPYGRIKGDSVFPIDDRSYIENEGHGGIEPLVKDLDYRLAKYIIEIEADYSKSDFQTFIREYLYLYGRNPLLSLLAKIQYIYRSCQVHITTGVSTDALLQTKSEGFDSVDDIPWRAHSIMEFFFEDKNLPTFIVYRGKIQDLLLSFGLDLDVEVEEGEGLHFFSETPSWMVGYFCVDNETLSSLISKDVSSLSFEAESILSLNTDACFTDQEFSHLSDAIMTCIRSLIYAHSESEGGQDYSEDCWEENVGKKSIKNGKPNVKGRPQGRIDKVIYLPKAIPYAESKEKSSCVSESDEKRAYYGKLPYSRLYKDDRFVNLKGKRVHYPECLGRNGESPLDNEMTKYIVRKRKTPFKIKS